MENADPQVITAGHNGPPIDSNTFAVNDQDGSVTGPNGYDDTAYTYSVSGADRDDFTFGSDGVLGFRTGPRA